MKDMFRLDGKVAIVTGGAGGIGEALAMGLGVQGATVVVASRNQAAIDKVAAEITEKTGNAAAAVAVDVTDEASVSGLVDTVMKKYGKIDILVNAMGMNIKKDAFEYPMEDWDKLFNVNVKGTMIACKIVGRVMRDQKRGAIVNLSSVRGIRGYTGGNTGYCATKGAVELITKALALEWAPAGHPGQRPRAGPGHHPRHEAHRGKPRTGQKIRRRRSPGKNRPARRHGRGGGLSGVGCGELCFRPDHLRGRRPDGGLRRDRTIFME